MASLDKKEFVDKDMLMITEQLRAKVKPLALTALRKKQRAIKETYQVKQKR